MIILICKQGLTRLNSVERICEGQKTSCYDTDSVDIGATKMDPRLEKRHQQLTRSHLQVGCKLAPGVKSILSKDVAFNQTQAAWRFLNNKRCTLASLSEPLLKAAHELSKDECDQYILVPHDWSHVFYGKHQSKLDTYNTIKRSVGYELHSSLLLSDRHGGPLAPVAMNLKTKEAVFSSYAHGLEGLTHLEELAKRVDWMELQSFNKPLIHIVDREGDSVDFFRALGDRHWLIRVNDANYAHDGTCRKKIKEIAKGLSFVDTRAIKYKGGNATQQIAEILVTITRDAHPKRKGENGKRLPLKKGEPVTVRLIVSRVIDKSGKELALWYLLSNVPDVLAGTLALWYYWRWSIESYFKLMKSAGMQLESWQQTTGLAIARRLLVASMACVWVWRIAHAKGAEAGELRTVLIRLSGRQMKWKKEFTYNALYAGLWILLSMDEILENYNTDKIKSLLSSVFGEKKLV